MQEEKLCSRASKVDDGEPHLIIEPEKNSLIHVHVLRFEVLRLCLMINSSLDNLDLCSISETAKFFVHSCLLLGSKLLDFLIAKKKKKNLVDNMKNEV